MIVTDYLFTSLYTWTFQLNILVVVADSQRFHETIKGVTERWADAVIVCEQSSVQITGENSQLWKVR